MAKDIDMCFEFNRLATFNNWIFKHDKTVKCTPKKMAEAGFYAIGGSDEPDLVKCFICFKELDGWSPTDDPLDEHRKHTTSCPFVTLNKKESDITLDEFLVLMTDVVIKRLHADYEQYIKTFVRQKDETIKRVRQLAKQQLKQ